jgi:NitT/TauT family transport system permease protein
MRIDRARLLSGNTVPVLAVVAVIVVAWFAGVVALNGPFQEMLYRTAGVTDYTATRFIADTMEQDRPVLPSPQQVAREVWKSVFTVPVTSKKSLVYHGWVTLSSTLLGFLIGSLLGIGLAVAIVHSRTLDKSLMPWIIASQTIPILAIAPMIIVVFNAINITGIVPKALISTYLSFFPVTVGVVAGLRSPEKLHLDLMRTYSASTGQTFWKLRWPSAVPFLFASMKVGIAASLVGAIVGEMPTGAVAGIGARLLSGSYYGQTTQIWAALLTAALMAAVLVTIVDLVDRSVRRRMGVRP